MEEIQGRLESLLLLAIFFKKKASKTSKVEAALLIQTMFRICTKLQNSDSANGVDSLPPLQSIFLCDQILC